MNTCTFTLNNYHAVGRADIALNGVTVLAGVNGCGKSTIARWLYAFIKYSNDFGKLTDDELLRRLNRKIQMFRHIQLPLGDVAITNAPPITTIPRSVFSDYGFDYDNVFNAFKSRMARFKTQAEKIDNPDYLKWLAGALGLNNEYSNSAGLLELINSSTLAEATEAIINAKETKAARSTEILYKYILRGLGLYTDRPDDMGFIENGLSLLSPANFIAPAGLCNAIYIDTPMALSNGNSTDNRIWKALREAMREPAGPMPDSAKKLAMRIRMIIGGDVELRNDDLSDDTELRYIRSRDGLNIPIDETATGLKSFAYLLRLLHNGHLTDRTLLLIDEPEAHLHPQWIVEFARTLVLLNKEVGTKVLVASHNPDMIAAIQAISRTEGITPDFYQADENGLRFDYRHLGDDIEPIFRSFNIALARIDQYGK